MVESVCVFCGSRYGVGSAYREAAEAFGAAVGRAGVRLIYGGGHVGLMGAAADAAMAAGGEVVGLIPERLLEREVGHRSITELVVTATMFDRKARMITDAAGFVILPGGLGTLDELLEVITLKQLGYHAKPIVIVDLDGYWRSFTLLVEQVVAQGFAGADAAELYQVVASVDAALEALGIEVAAAPSRTVARSAAS
jgi:uncharacterized protein (TIGR00730 family)